MKKTIAIITALILIIALFPAVALAGTDTTEQSKIDAFGAITNPDTGAKNSNLLASSMGFPSILWTTPVNPGDPSYMQKLNWSEKSIYGNLDLSGFTHLKAVAVNNNKLTGLDLTGCTSLDDITCALNHLTSIKATLGDHYCSIQSAGNGYVEINYFKGSSPYITAVPAPSYAFVKWTDNNVDVSTSAKYTFTNDKDHSFQVFFAPGCTITFDKNGQSNASSMPSSQTVVIGGKVTKPTADPTCKGYTFGGWFKDAACTTAWDFDTDTASTATTIFAKWTAAAAPTATPTATTSPSPSSGTHKITIYVNGRDTLHPSIAGENSEWSFIPDNYNDYMDITMHADGSLDITGKKAGKVTAIYHRNGMDETFYITIKASKLPSTGQDFSWVWILGAAAVIVSGSACLMLRRKKSRA